MTVKYFWCVFMVAALSRLQTQLKNKAETLYDTKLIQSVFFLVLYSQKNEKKKIKMCFSVSKLRNSIQQLMQQ